MFTPIHFGDVTLGMAHHAVRAPYCAVLARCVDSGASRGGPGPTGGGQGGTEPSHATYILYTYHTYTPRFRPHCDRPSAGHSSLAAEYRADCPAAVTLADLGFRPGCCPVGIWSKFREVGTV